MKKNCLIFHLLTLLCVTLLFTTGCNKPYTPPEVVGNWSFLDNAFNLYVNSTLEGYTPSLENKLIDAVNRMKDVLVEPNAIRLASDNSFHFIYKSGEMSTGTYTQSQQTLVFQFTALEVSELIGYTDGEYLELLFSVLTLKPLFLSLFDLESEEFEILFREDNPVISGMEASVIFKKDG